MIRPITSLPQDPFPSICDITHLWYRMVATNNGWHYFDFVEVLCKMVSSTVVPLKIKLQYSGTYLLYSPPIAIFVAPVGQQPAHPPLVPTASLMGSAQATLQSQQDCQRSSTAATPAQSSVVAATHAYTRGIGRSLRRYRQQLQQLHLFHRRHLRQQQLHKRKRRTMTLMTRT